MNIISNIFNPLELFRAYRFHKNQKKHIKSSEDQELMLYSKIISNDMLHYGYFDNVDIKSDAISLRDLEKAQMVFDFSLSIVLLISPLLYFFVDEIIILLLNKSYMVIGPYMELFSFGVGPFLIFVILRGILDGIENYPYINMITGVGMVVTIILSIGTIIFGWGWGD